MPVLQGKMWGSEAFFVLVLGRERLRVRWHNDTGR
jgi:hypothetical protein